MDKEQQKKTNRNNRKRGSQFERSISNALDMDVVPYSGSNSRFGYGDVRDTIWLGECKNITPDDDVIVVKKEWIDKNEERADSYNKKSFIAFMECGRPAKYIMIGMDTFKWIRSFNPRYNITKTLDIECKHNTVNFRLPKLSLPVGGTKPNIVHVRLIRDGVAFDEMVLMNISLFIIMRDIIPEIKGGKTITL